MRQNSVGEFCFVELEKDAAWTVAVVGWMDGWMDASDGAGIVVAGVEAVVVRGVVRCTCHCDK